MTAAFAAAGPPWQEGVIQTVIAFAAMAAVWLIVVRLGRRVIERLVNRETNRADVHGEDRAQRIRTLWTVGRAVVTVVIVGVFLLLALDIWGIPIAPFLAVGSVVAVAIGFGAQDLVKDVIAGLFIIVEDQYGIDDVVEIAGVSGRVQSIRLRTTVLRDQNGHVHHVPNGQITVASNYTQVFSQIVVDVGIAYESDVDRALEVIEEEAGLLTRDPTWSEAFLEPAEVQGVEKLGDSAVVLRTVFKVRPSFRLTVRREWLRRLKNRCDAEGIEIPYQKLTVLHQDVPQVTEPD